MNAKRLKSISKYLSLHLRHQPDALGLSLEPGGWVPVEQLLAACNAQGQSLFQEQPLSHELLTVVVSSNDKQRFSFSADGQKIRANQGHSVAVDLQLLPQQPPAVLYHGTGESAVPDILAEGLSKMNRHHVHLSANPETAKAVGSRHGSPVIFEVAAARMAQQGALFYCSDNGVWLVDEVPVAYLRQLSV